MLSYPSTSIKMRLPIMPVYRGGLGKRRVQKTRSARLLWYLPAPLFFRFTPVDFGCLSFCEESALGSQPGVEKLRGTPEAREAAFSRSLIALSDGPVPAITAHYSP